MKILYDGRILLNILNNDSNKSGIFYVVFNLLKEISKENKVCIYFCKFDDYLKYNDNLDYFTKLFDKKIDCLNDKFLDKNIKLYFDKLDTKYVKYKNLKNNTKNLLFKMFLNLLKSFYKRKIKKLNKIYNLKHKNCNLNKFDVFLSPFNAFPDIINNNKKIKKSIILYDTMPINFPQYYKNFNINDNSDYAMMLKNLDKDTYCFCISEQTRNDFLKHCGDKLDKNKMFVMPIATSQNFYQEKDSVKLEKVLDKYNVSKEQRGKYIFSLCTLEPRKNLIFTIKCFIEFIKENNINDLYFYLGGGHWEDFIDKLEKEINDLGKYKNKIVKLGYIDNEDINTLYSNSLFFTYISLYEGFGMPPLEAMTCGVPVLTSNTSSIPEVVGDAAIMINPTDNKACIESMKNLYYNENLRNELIKRGLEQSKKFSWEKSVEIIIKNLNK